MRRLVNELHEEWNFNFFIYSLARVVAFAVLILLVVGIYGALEPVNKAAGSQEQVFSKEYHAIARRILVSSNSTKGTKSNRPSSLREDDYGDDNTGSDGGNDDDGSMNRIGIGAGCSKDNILVFQGPTSPPPNGIPTHTVEIQNVCVSSISNIHLNCGWFSSARLINPKIFRRVGYDDCLVNDGAPLNPGETISFQYANTFKYPLQVSSVAELVMCLIVCNK